jgi:hypothetical protein
MMALSIALSVIAITGVALSARIVYGMASHLVLPQFLGTVSPRSLQPPRRPANRRAERRLPPGHLGAAAGSPGRSR